MLEELVVFGAVAWAASYAAWRLMPAALRGALGERCARLALRRGASSTAPADAKTARRRAAAERNSACGGCTGCSPERAPPRVAIIHLKDK
ncbi:DUF6587 family protein [Accumulibacter sp.]|uniref:DUF6587 family protein n=1 Tax=Accumulibacter sp. TaxID=2053492 RepID=UPI0026114F1C|nr:DUF6587 family protein [Accumulibacter sp.]